MSFNIQLEKFEGPLDLLLYFIRRDELDIYDIPISKITEDFINTINEWKRLNLVIAGEFIVMASTLMRIKARMMIPRIDLDEEGENIDPRTELMQRLIDYKRFRSAAEILSNMASENSGHFKRQIDLTKISDKNDEGLDEFFKEKIELNYRIAILLTSNEEGKKSDGFIDKIVEDMIANNDEIDFITNANRLTKVNIINFDENKLD